MADHRDLHSFPTRRSSDLGQTVFHFHLHMIPRYKNDGVGLGWKIGKLTDEDKEELLAKIK